MSRNTVKPVRKLIRRGGRLYLNLRAPITIKGAEMSVCQVVSDIIDAAIRNPELMARAEARLGAH